MTWPKRYGGGERSFLERYTVTEELLAAGAPVGCHWIADRQSGPLLAALRQRRAAREFLPGICRGEIFFAIGMSEPDSGSDLASIRTRAIPVCGGYEVTGAKVWTSYAHESHYAITLVRTDDARPKNRHRRAVAADRRSEGAGGDDPADPQSRRRARFQRDRARPRLRAERAAGRRRGRRLAPGDQRTRLRAQRPGAVSVARIRCWSGWSSAPATIPSRRWPRRSAASAAQSVDAAADVAVGRRHAAGRRNPEPRSGAGQGSGRRLRARRPGAGARLDPAARRQRPMGDRLEAALAEAVLHAPSWTLRGGTREILRGIIARGLGLR